MKPYFYMMIGLPGCGKSTLVSKLSEILPTKPILVSSDHYIEERARFLGKTYDDVFKDYIKVAEKGMYDCATLALNQGHDVIWDQTNLSRKSRQKKLSMVPDSYRKIACVVQKPDDEEWFRRLESRPGKTISRHILESMAETYSAPTKEEGFDSVLFF